MTDYTPTTEEVRENYARSLLWPAAQDPARAAFFDRWLAAHDAEVRSRALRDAADRLERDLGERAPGVVLSTRESRRLRAMDEEERGLR